jgi:PhoPQ-activated pathogenicity-related protein
VVEATAAFYADVLAKRERPKLEWTTVVRDGAAATKLTLKDEPIRTELWTAASETRDFRKARWAPAELECKDGRCEAVVKVPEKGFSAYHVRVTYRSALGDEYGLCTNVEVLKAEK